MSQVLQKGIDVGCVYFNRNDRSRSTLSSVQLTDNTLNYDLQPTDGALSSVQLTDNIHVLNVFKSTDSTKPTDSTLDSTQITDCTLSSIHPIDSSVQSTGGCVIKSGC